MDKAGVERPIGHSAAPIRDVNGRVSGAVLVFRDVTERRRLDELLRQAQKMEAVGQLAGGIAHDFNNLMTIITGFSEILLADGQSPATRHDFVQNIYEAGKRAAALTQQIMAFGCKQMLVPCMMNLNNVVRDMRTMVERLIEPTIEFVIDTAPNLGQVKTDPTQISQVVLNLAANARDAMPKGGRLTAATSNAALGEETPRLNPDIKPGRYAMLSVSDTGSGMTEDMLTHVFEPFFTTKGIGQGTGLGLATVHGIIKQSGGHIECSSRVGIGTKFRVYLPLIEEQAPLRDGEEKWSATKGWQTILLVEDEKAIRQMTKMVLTQSGYNVLEASNCLDGVTVAEQYQGPIHLLLTDLVMPKLSGREMAERLAALKPGLRVLFMSGYTEDLLVHQGVESAAADFLAKPFSLAALTTKVQEVLDRP